VHKEHQENCPCEDKGEEPGCKDLRRCELSLHREILCDFLTFTVSRFLVPFFIEIVDEAVNHIPKSLRRKYPENSNPKQIVSGYGGGKVDQGKIMIEGKKYLLRAVFEKF
jgi:hypothetical protein